MIRYLRWFLRLLWFPCYFLWQIIVSNAVVGRDVLTPGSRISAGFVEVPLRCRSSFETMMIANMITLTPGTVTVAVHEASRTLWIHSLYVTSPDDVRADIWAMESHLLGATRLDGAPAQLPHVGAWQEVTRR